MVKPTLEQKASLIAQCVVAVCASPEAWRTFEHEVKDNETFEEWAIRRGESMAIKIWKKSQ